MKQADSILLVTCDPIMLALVRAVFRPWRIGIVRTCCQALQAIDAGDYHVLLIDWVSSGEQHLECLYDLCDRAYRPAIVVLTSDIRLEIYAPQLAACAARFVKKPFTSAALRQAVLQAAPF